MFERQHSGKRGEGEHDESLLVNQGEAALLIGITPRAFANWRVEPVEKRGRESLYFWPDVVAERNRRLIAPLERRLDSLTREALDFARGGR